jgi:L-rhamnonate dehydratase
MEECLQPHDYEGFGRLNQEIKSTRIATGEHEYTRYGFRQLLDNHAASIWQPDIHWCGGLTELLRIAAYAEAHGIRVVPHGSSVYSYHFAVTRPSTQFVEFLMMSPEADEVVPMFTPLLLDEPVANGRPYSLERPGFGVELNRGSSSSARSPVSRRGARRARPHRSERELRGGAPCRAPDR